jgi:hypothetical protein
MTQESSIFVAKVYEYETTLPVRFSWNRDHWTRGLLPSRGREGSILVI